MELSELLKTTRQYFWDQNFVEVEPNYLNTTLPLEPNIYLYSVNNQYFLPASPEFACKDFLVKQKKNCFSVAHSFRHEPDTSPLHLPEFMMLEYYLVNQNVTDLQKSVQDFVSKFLNLKFLNIKLPPGNFSNEPDFNQYFLNEIEPNLPKDKAVFVTGYPAFLSPLAKTVKDGVDNFEERNLRADIAKGREHRQNSSTSLRFELYINGIEIANGCEENRNAEQIKEAFEAERLRRVSQNLPAHPYSDKFISSCANLPPCAGVALGLNRLLMLINHQNSL